jgi:hypothetical protein
MWVDEVRVFGSYLSGAERLGDLDLAVAWSWRPAWRYQGAPAVYAEASGRRFASFFDRVAWAERELRMALRNRSPYISLTTQDVTALTDRRRTVYQREPRP